MIVVGGENLIDFIQEPGDGGHPVYRANPGGSPFNVAMAVGRQGLPVGYLTPISDDTLGALLRDTLTASGVVTLAPPHPAPTSLAVVSLTEGQAAYQFYRDTTAERQVSARSLRESLPADVTALHIGSLALTDGADADAWTDLAEALAADGVAITFDPNIRAAFIHDRAAYTARFERVAAVARVLKLSDEDADWLFPGVPVQAAAQALFDRANPALGVLTLGADGAFGQSGGATVTAAAAPVPTLVDTVGAGDTFMATLIDGMARRGFPPDLSADDIGRLLNRAAKAAAINCGRKGCQPPTADELDR